MGFLSLTAIFLGFDVYVAAHLTTMVWYGCIYTLKIDNIVLEVIPLENWIIYIGILMTLTLTIFGSDIRKAILPSSLDLLQGQ